MASKKFKVKDAARKRRQRDDANDIGKIPEVKNAKRRERAVSDFEFFCRTYLPGIFYRPWSRDQRRIVDGIQSIISGGGQKAYAMPRGEGKTSLAKAGATWATMTGQRRYTVFLGSSSTKAAELLDFTKTALLSFDIFHDDFPEVCYPIRHADGKPARAKNQTFKGASTHLEWTASAIAMPVIPGSAASGSALESYGIFAGYRGLSRTTVDGKSLRPDLVIIDDPETDELAASPTQCKKLLELINGAILGLAGIGNPIAVLMPCTVIQRGDAVDQLLDRKLNPHWRGDRTKMLYTFPGRMDLWERYRDIRDDGIRAEDGGLAGNEFYAANREAMDEGADPGNPERKNANELSAVQHAMNHFFQNRSAFFAEYQNEPEEEQSDTPKLKPENVMAKVNKLGRGVVPVWASAITAYIDVQGELLFWVACAWGPDFTGHVIDYGAYPEQRRSYFTLRDVTTTLLTVSPGAKTEGAITAGIHRLTDLLADRDWQTEAGSSLRISRILIDANWGPQTTTVYEAIRRAKHSNIIRPSHGRGIEAGDAPLVLWKKEPGELRRPNVIERASKSRGVRAVTIDTNYWKSFAADALLATIGDKGSLTLFGDRPERHRMFADHAVSEVRDRQHSEKTQRTVDVWSLKPGKPDNHLFDCLAGAAAAASLIGITLPEHTARPVVRQRVKLSELQKQKRAQQYGR